MTFQGGYRLENSTQNPLKPKSALLFPLSTACIVVEMTYPCWYAMFENTSARMHRLILLHLHVVRQYYFAVVSTMHACLLKNSNIMAVSTSLQ
jgi:hypothetical protein